MVAVLLIASTAAALLLSRRRSETQGLQSSARRQLWRMSNLLSSDEATNNIENIESSSGPVSMEVQTLNYSQHQSATQKDLPEAVTLLVAAPAVWTTAKYTRKSDAKVMRAAGASCSRPRTKIIQVCNPVLKAAD